MPQDNRQRAPQQKIEERRNRLGSVIDYVAKLRSDGVIGNKNQQEGDVALQDPVSVRFESDHSMILKEIEFANPRFSQVKRSDENVDKRIKNLEKETMDTSIRRKDLLDLYKTVFYQDLPPQAPELLLSIVVPKTEIATLNSSGIGIREAFAECPLSASSMSRADSAQVHNTALFFMCKEAVSKIEFAYEKTAVDQKALREFIGKKAMLLQNCLRTSRKGVADMTKLVNLASCIVTDIIQLVETGAKQITKSVFHEKLQRQKNEYTDLTSQKLDPPLVGAPMLQPRELNSLLLRETEAEECWRWSASDEELAAWEAQKGSNCERPWSVTSGKGFKIETANFTYELMKNRIPAVTGIPVLFTSSPSSDQYIRTSYPEQGGYALVYHIKLPKDFKVSDAASNTKEFMKKNGPITNVAVKSIIPYTKDGLPEENEHRTCIRLARESRIWSKMRHENIIPLMGFWDNFEPLSLCLSFVSPWMDHRNLHEYMKEHPELKESERIRFSMHIANALSYMHNQTCPITHGDLRADNVLLKNNTAYLCDFGISNILDQSKGLTTDPHGRVRWQATEQLIDDPETGAPLKANIRSDIYSFGSVFLEVLTGKQPWSNLDMNETELEQYRVENPAAIQTRPSDITNNDHWALMLKCWRKEPTLRPTANMALSSMISFLG